MTVTVVADVLGKENNGTTIACLNLIRYLRSCGDTVRILCADEDKRGQEGVYVAPTLDLGFALNKVLDKNEVVVARSDPAVVAAALEGADVCHVMTPFFLGHAAVTECKRRGVPVTAGFHCQAENFTSHIFLINSALANREYYNFVWAHFYKYVDLIHYPSQFIRDVFEACVGRPTPGVVVSNGVGDIYRPRKVERPEWLRDKFVVLFIGRLSREKSHKVLVKAVKYSKYRDRIQLMFAGCGPRKGQIMRCVRRCGITPPDINFYSRSDLVDLINYSDLYCHPAEIEIEAISCLEAISCGLVPVISDSPRSATKAFALDENNLFSCNDPRDLARKIDFWIEHPELKAEYARRYEGFTKQFDQTECMRKTRQILVDAYEKANQNDLVL
ncbi:MAG: glycosyltransferase [Oscillospiraceae bacterium]|nr:glycosyltransferase [Oscillospiraceae bacterium]